MAPLTIGTAAMIATRTYSRSSLGPPGTNSALLNTAWMSSGLTMPIVEVSTMSPTTAATRPRYGLNSGITRRAVFRPTCACGPRVVIRPLSHRAGPWSYRHSGRLLAGAARPELDEGHDGDGQHQPRGE